MATKILQAAHLNSKLMVVLDYALPVISALIAIRVIIKAELFA